MVQTHCKVKATEKEMTEHSIKDVLSAVDKVEEVVKPLIEKENKCIGIAVSEDKVAIGDCDVLNAARAIANGEPDWLHVFAERLGHEPTNSDEEAMRQIATSIVRVLTREKRERIDTIEDMGVESQEKISFDEYRAYLIREKYGDRHDVYLFNTYYINNGGDLTVKRYFLEWCEYWNPFIKNLHKDSKSSTSEKPAEFIQNLLHNEDTSG